MAAPAEDDLVECVARAIEAALDEVGREHTRSTTHDVIRITRTKPTKHLIVFHTKAGAEVLVLYKNRARARVPILPGDDLGAKARLAVSK